VIPYLPYVSVGIVLIGWFATHILTLRAQKLNLRLQVLDRSRQEIIKEMRVAQDWYRRVTTALVVAEVHHGAVLLGVSPAWREHVDNIVALLNPVPATWILRLEEYEILFPETAVVPERLLDRQRSIVQRISSFSSGLMKAAFLPEERAALFRESIGWLEDVHDQAFLLEDMALHLQNETLSKIAGRRIPARPPRNPSLPKVIRGKDGLLCIEPDRMGETMSTTSHDPRRPNHALQPDDHLGRFAPSVARR
jgi:hypothetical protein